MKYFFHNFYFFTAVITVHLVFCFKKEDDNNNVKRFIVVSDFTIARPLFYEIRKTSKQPLDNIQNIAMRRRICADIFGSVKFAANREYPIERLRDDFRFKVLANYSDTDIKVSCGNKLSFDEYDVFRCRTRKKSRINEYFVSREYNLLGGWNYVGARFVFHTSQFLENPTVDFIAEEHASDFLSTDYTIEDIYLHRRAGLMPSKSRRDDPVCKLNKKEKLRICLAVFNSAYFKRRIRYPVSKIGRIQGVCELETVFFQTKLAKPEMFWNGSEEWMLSCQTSEGSFDYYLSHAYRNHEVFVYVRHQETEIYLENLSINVRLALDKESFRLLSDDKMYDMSNDYLYEASGGKIYKG